MACRLSNCACFVVYVFDRAALRSTRGDHSPPPAPRPRSCAPRRHRCTCVQCVATGRGRRRRAVLFCIQQRWTARWRGSLLARAQQRRATRWRCCRRRCCCSDLHARRGVLVTLPALLVAACIGHCAGTGVRDTGSAALRDRRRDAARQPRHLYEAAAHQEDERAQAQETRETHARPWRQKCALKIEDGLSAPPDGRRRGTARASSALRATEANADWCARLCVRSATRQVQSLVACVPPGIMQCRWRQDGTEGGQRVTVLSLCCCAHMRSVYDGLRLRGLGTWPRSLCISVRLLSSPNERGLRC